MPGLVQSSSVSSEISDAEKSEISEETEQPHKKKIRRFNARKDRHRIEYEVIKRFLTGNRADRQMEEIIFEIGELAQKETLVAWLDKLIKHSDTDLGFWKKEQEHESKGLHYTMYRCPME